MAKSIDITTLSGFSSLAAGTYAMGVKAHGTGEYTDSPMSATSNYIIYSVAGTATNCQVGGAASYSGTIGQSQTVTLSLSADGTSYKLPDQTASGLPSGWSVSGATAVYSKTSDTAGSLSLSSPTGNISFTVVGEEIASGETWMINELPTDTALNGTFYINFISNSTNYTSMQFAVGPLLRPDLNYIYYDNTMVLGPAAGPGGELYPSWFDTAYRTVTFETSPTGDLLTWLQANAVRQ